MRRPRGGLPPQVLRTNYRLRTGDFGSPVLVAPPHEGEGAGQMLFARLRPGVERLVDLFQTGRIDVGVDLRRGDAGVAEQFLDVA